MTSQTITAAAAGSWTLGDLTVRRIGFGAMRLAQTGPALVPGAVPRDRAQGRGCRTPGRTGCAGWWRRTCASSAATTWTW